MILEGSSAVRKLWRKLLHVWFLAKRRSDVRGTSGPVLENVCGRPLVVLPKVFNPRLLRSGAFLAESLDSEIVPVGSRLLDLGTGSGVAAVAASARASTVVAVDISPEAVRCARINVLLNGLEEKIEVRQGDLFEPVASERFDVVVFNPPYFRGEPADERDHAWRSPDVDERFASELSRHLSADGHALLCLSTDGDLAFLEKLRHAGFSIEAVAERDLLNEVLRLYRVSRSSA